MKFVRVGVEGMTCENCERHVGEALKKLGAKKVKVSHKERLASFDVKEVDKDKIRKAVLDAGYEVKSISVEEKAGFFGGVFK